MSNSVPTVDSLGASQLDASLLKAFAAPIAASGRGGRTVAGALLAAGSIAATVAARKLANEASKIAATAIPRLDDAMATPELEIHSFASRDGGTIRYVDTAPGRHDRPVVVLMHGISLQWWIWSAVISGLEDSHRVIAWDMRGFGRSVAGTDGVTIPAAARDLDGLLRHLDLREAVVVGHSMGGMVLGQFLIDFPEATAPEGVKVPSPRVAGAVFADTSGHIVRGGRSEGTSGTAWLAPKALRMGLSPERLRWNDGPLSTTLVRSAFGTVVTKRMVDDMCTCQKQASTESLIEGMSSIASHDVLTGLSKVRVPVEVIVGSLDKLTPPKHAQQLAAAIPGANLTTLDRIGHNIMQEAPEAVVAAVARVLARCEQGARP